ncbi:WD40 repeat-like protein [Ascodesmis nigricans]|uniref:WD40 repeat-like protein n=1 Tax=Ascodesmis nigricans TaxID=341454 RepID=A0A4S2N2I9_9PEZI|nr:WD40 repeat-like protein [Ascodesmis nigricans]
MRVYHEHTRSTLSIRDLSWNAPGTRIACALSDKLVRVWNPEKPEIRYSTELKGHGQAVAAVVWDPLHSDILSSCSADQALRVWDYRAKTCQGTVYTNGENVAHAWSPDGSTIAVASRDQKVHFVDVKTWKMVSHEVPDAVNAMEFGHAGDCLLMATASGRVLIYAFPEMVEVHSVEAHASAAHCLALDPRGVHLAVGGSDAVVGLWDTQDWICVRTLRGMDSPIRSVDFSFDGAYIVAGSEDLHCKDLEINHVDTGEHVHTISTNHPVTKAKWHPHRYWLAYSGDPTGMKVVQLPNQ